MVDPLRAGRLHGVEEMAPSRGGFAVLRFVRCLLYVPGAMRGLGSRLYKATFQVRRLKVPVLCPHRKERWEPGHLAEVPGMEALKSDHDLA